MSEYTVEDILSPVEELEQALDNIKRYHEAKYFSEIERFEEIIEQYEKAIEVLNND